jgi:hypothetical protein
MRDGQGKPEVRAHALLLYQLLQSNGTCDQLNAAPIKFRVFSLQSTQKVAS